MATIEQTHRKDAAPNSCENGKVSAGLCLLSALILTSGCFDRSAQVAPEKSPITPARVLDDKSLVGREVIVTGHSQLLTSSTSPLVAWFPSFPFERTDETYRLLDGPGSQTGLPLITTRPLPEGLVRLRGIVISENGKPALKVTSVQ